MKDFGFLQIWKPMHHLVLISWCSFIDHHLTLVFVLTILSCDAGATEAAWILLCLWFEDKGKEPQGEIPFGYIFLPFAFLYPWLVCVWFGAYQFMCFWGFGHFFSFWEFGFAMWLISCGWRLAATGLQLLLLPLSMSFDICITHLYSVLMVVLDS